MICSSIEFDKVNVNIVLLLYNNSHCGLHFTVNLIK